MKIIWTKSTETVFVSDKWKYECHTVLLLLLLKKTIKITFSYRLDGTIDTVNKCYRKLLKKNEWNICCENLYLFYVNFYCNSFGKNTKLQSFSVR